jgi:hypothetical protein
MTNRSERATHFATLFETVTGQSVLTDEQQIEVPVRYDERGEKTEISEYLDTTATAQGFGDVIDGPDAY